jgi:hypothetical protein
VPVSVLEKFNDLSRKICGLAPGNQTAAAFHDHVSYDLFAVTELLHKVSKQAREIELQVDHVFLEEKGDNFDGGE